MLLEPFKDLADEIEQSFTTTPQLGDVTIEVPEQMYMRLASDFRRWPINSGLLRTRAGMGDWGKGIPTVIVINEFLIIKPKVEDGPHPQ